ncbi:hypothetical protein GII30_19745 [Gordonia amarae]|uniref:Uncharacterized protein n=2 Tax=Gordonia amarae TaxID=36821 RepID=G7GQ05_9ACTN|nr:hypothetical protein [Gordonia amarae]MCS3880674.1 hypothetical protein [Gordonia amarae]QHN18971.1 hypothetical protein GII35_20100 [Gordonia amarae]QHN23446.1 hypothetical protein GII34_19600 [Gordonia amarae]QHN32346.1 hypothetical protein GII32_19915 [Gordonia amarae]QHN41094.1 hypothetical protein GII30_19745 [Gordonia amarae]
MSDSLQHLLEPGRREAVVADLASVIDSEVAEKKGLSGTAIKAGYNAANKFKPGLVPHATDKLLPEFAAALAPFWDSRPAGAAFGDHLAANSDAAAEALLAITDGHAEGAKAPLQRAYGALRGKAKENVAEALPKVGAAIEKNA